MVSSILLLVAQVLYRPAFLAEGILSLRERLRLKDDLWPDGQVDERLHL